jgi:hypothetical protein
MEFAGEFESHLTVLIQHPERLTELRKWAEANALKCLHIVLDRGLFASQPMLTRRGRGSLSTELAIARRLTERLNAAGFEVLRIKLEASPENEGIPLTDTESMRSNDNRYFEHHVKLLIDNEARVPALTDIALRHYAHVSRNALQVRSDGMQERFITQRCRRVGLPSANRQLSDLLEELKKRSQLVIEVEREFVVYDSNCKIDKGWIDGEE